MRDRILVLGLLGVAACVAGCAEADYEIERVRESARPMPMEPSLQRRLFGDPSQRTTRQAPPPGEIANLLLWTVPAGWQQLPAQPLREINLRVGEVECYLSYVNAGGAAANVNRWRGQMGQPALDPDGIEKLKTARLLDRDAHRLDLTGTYTGRDGAGKPDHRMVALYAQFPQFAFSVKMLGPAAQVAAQVGAFDAFCASLAFDGEKLGGATQEPGAGAHGGGKLAWAVPEGWTAQKVQTGGMGARHASFDLGGGAECYVTFMGGTAGGLGPNVNRWLGQVGLPELDGAGIGALPSLDILGRKSPLLEAYGAENSILATLTVFPDQTMFVKLTGPTAAVKPHRDRFVAFCRSLREER